MSSAAARHRDVDVAPGRGVPTANVVAELRQGEHGNRGLGERFAAADSNDLALSVLVLAEVRLGILTGGWPRPLGRGMW